MGLIVLGISKPKISSCLIGRHWIYIHHIPMGVKKIPFYKSFLPPRFQIFFKNRSAMLKGLNTNLFFLFRDLLLLVIS